MSEYESTNFIPENRNSEPTAENLNNNLIPAPETFVATTESTPFDNGFHPENIPAIKNLDEKIKAIQAEAQQNIAPIANTETLDQMHNEANPETLRYTPEQLNNIQAMNLFQEQLPNTFMERSSEKHKKTLVAKEAVNGLSGDEASKYIIIMSEDGITTIGGEGYELKDPSQNLIRTLDVDKIQDSFNPIVKQGAYQIEVTPNSKLTKLSKLSFENWGKGQMVHLITELKSVDKKHEHDNDEPPKMTIDEIKGLF